MNHSHLGQFYDQGYPQSPWGMPPQQMMYSANGFMPYNHQP